MMRLFCRVVLMVLWMNTCILPGYSMGERPLSQVYIRVALMKDVKDVMFKIRGPYQMIDQKTGKVLKEGKRLKKCILTAEKGIRIDKEFHKIKRLKILIAKDIAFNLQGKYHKYRGDVEVILNDNDTFTIINHIDVEDYIRGVLYKEVSHRWPLEAIKAQAVAARTYALFRMAERKKFDFDVTSDIFSQVYGGRSSERYRTNLAVKKTQGEIMVYKGKILPAYYHSNCGGHTEDVSLLWEDKSIPPLKGKACFFCEHTPNSNWTVNFQLKTIQ